MLSNIHIPLRSPASDLRWTDQTMGTGDSSLPSSLQYYSYASSFWIMLDHVGTKCLNSDVSQTLGRLKAHGLCLAEEKQMHFLERKLSLEERHTNLEVPPACMPDRATGKPTWRFLHSPYHCSDHGWWSQIQRRLPSSPSTPPLLQAGTFLLFGNPHLGAMGPKCIPGGEVLHINESQ